MHATKKRTVIAERQALGGLGRQALSGGPRRIITELEPGSGRMAWASGERAWAAEECFQGASQRYCSRGPAHRSMAE